MIDTKNIHPEIFVVENKMKTIGIVGAGPAGLYAASRLSKKGFSVWLWEKEKFIGGRTRMGHVANQKVVGGAGVIRDKDRRSKKLARPLLKPFHSKYHVSFGNQHDQLQSWISR